MLQKFSKQRVFRRKSEALIAVKQHRKIFPAARRDKCAAMGAGVHAVKMLRIQLQIA